MPNFFLYHLKSWSFLCETCFPSAPTSSRFSYFHVVVTSSFSVLYAFFWRRQWHPTPVLLPGNSHGRRSLVGCRPWSREESDMTERLHFHFSLSCIGEGNVNPLQCSCLGNPRDRGAWWAAVYGVAQSWTILKRFSSSSSKFICNPKVASFFLNGYL